MGRGQGHTLKRCCHPGKQERGPEVRCVITHRVGQILGIRENPHDASPLNMGVKDLNHSCFLCPRKGKRSVFHGSFQGRDQANSKIPEHPGVLEINLITRDDKGNGDRCLWA